MKKSILYARRTKARELKKKGWSNSRIARYLGAGKDSVKKWIEMNEEELLEDGRGWRRGAGRKYSSADARRLEGLYTQLLKRGGKVSSSKLLKDFQERYGKTVSHWFLYKTIRQFKERMERTSVKSLHDRPLDVCNRELKNIAEVIMAVDLIRVETFAQGEDTVTWICCKYECPFKCGVLTQVNKVSVDEILGVFKTVWMKYGKPDLLKMSDRFFLSENSRRNARLGRIALFLLNVGVLPFYIDCDERECAVQLKSMWDLVPRLFEDILRFPHERKSDHKVLNFDFEYSTSEHLAHARQSPGRCEIDKDVDWTPAMNRLVENFQADTIYIAQRVREGSLAREKGKRGVVHFFGKDFHVDSEWIGSKVICKLNLSRKQLVVTTELDDGTNVAVETFPFEMENVF